MATTLIRGRKVGTRRLETLTNQQQMFVKELLADSSFDLTRAAKKSGYKSPSSAGNRLLKNKIVSAAIGKAIKDRSDALEFTAEEVLTRLKAILEIDLTDLYDDEGHCSMKTIKELPDHIRQCITKIKTNKRSYIDEDGVRHYENVYEIEWMSKDSALQLAMRHFGLMQPEINVNIINDEVKARVLVEMMHQQELESPTSGVIDATAIARIARYEPEKPVIEDKTK